MLALIAVLLLVATGFVFAGACIPFRFGWNPETCFFLFLGAGLGAGLTSMEWFLCWWLFTAPATPALLMETVSLVACTWLFCRRMGTPVEFGLPKRAQWSAVRLVTLLGITAAVVAAVVYFVRFSVMAPHGEWDAWSIWNLHARFLYLGKGASWKALFGPELLYSHADYPLMLPMSIARLWTFEGSDMSTGPQIVAFLFTFGTVGLVGTGVWILRGPVQGCVAVIALLGADQFVHLGAGQYADVPIGFFVVAAIVLLACYDEFDLRNPGFMVLAGAAAGCALWTKNEGWLVLAGIVGSRLLTLWMGSCQRHWREILYFAAGASGPVLLTSAFKIVLAPPGDIFASMTGSAVFSAFLDFDRLRIIVSTLAGEIWKFGGWFPSIIVVGTTYALCLGIVGGRSRRVTALRGWSALAIIVGGDIAVYLLGKNEIRWWLSTSASRVLLQLWPAAIFLFFTLVRVPGTVRKDAE